MSNEKEVKIVPSDEARLKQLEQEIEALKAMARGERSSQTPRPIQEKTSQVMFMEDCPVVRYGEAKENDRNILMIDIWILKDGKEEYRKVELLDMLNHGIRQACKIIKQDFKREMVHQGQLPQFIVTKDPDEARIEGSHSFYPQKVLLEEEKVVVKSTVEFLTGPMTGKTLVIDNDALNR